MKKIYASPIKIVILSFLLVIITGTILLKLPVASNVPVDTVDALFTATSAVCVTGLTTVSTIDTWTMFGKIVLMGLIQIGGLGLTTFVAIVMNLVGRRITLKERLILQESLNQDKQEKLLNLIYVSVFFTFLAEMLGTVFLGLRFAKEFGFCRGIWYGLFHSISAFCNAGFDILGNTSLMAYAGDIYLNTVFMCLIVAGGIGFPVWMDIVRVLRIKNKNLTLRQRVRHLSLHAKLACFITGILISGGFFLFLFLEWNNPETLGSMSPLKKMTAALFQSVTLRTAGFFSINQGDLTYASKFISVLMMFIGGSPAGTAGGIKTVTLGVIYACVFSILQGRNSIRIFHKEIPFSTLQKALTVLFLSAFALSGATILLTLTEGESIDFLDIFYEVASALGTTGLSTGITPNLSDVGKIILTATMFVGRVGPISVVAALTFRQKKRKSQIKYSEENVIVG
ncbi:MAG: TrkH family potassium uptake protein [Clostridiales bacterium]|nr:TrkH family potassium uptake protein [Clostridiales bacterium]